MAEYTVSAWMERLMKLTKGYELADIWNMDETGCFFKALPEKGLVEKKNQARGGKKSKTRLTIAFFVNAAGEKAIKPLVVWRSKTPRCFKNIKSSCRPHDIHLLLLHYESMDDYRNYDINSGQNQSTDGSC